MIAKTHLSEEQIQGLADGTLRGPEGFAAREHCDDCPACASELAAFSANNWHASGDPRFGWIGVLGVRPRWRRRGLATALLHQSFRDFRRRGATRVGLGVDAENMTGAVRLYERVGMHVVRRNDTYEKRL